MIVIMIMLSKNIISTFMFLSSSLQMFRTFQLILIICCIIPWISSSSSSFDNYLHKHYHNNHHHHNDENELNHYRQRNDYLNIENDDNDHSYQNNIYDRIRKHPRSLIDDESTSFSLVADVHETNLPVSDISVQPELSSSIIDFNYITIGENNNNNNITDDINHLSTIGIDGDDDTSITYDDRLCPRDREEAKARGQSCLRKCNSHKDCISSKRRCLCDGLCGWSCIRPDLNCEELPGVANSRYTLTNGNFFHSKLIYECDPGYIMSGTGRERICQGDGSWSGWPPQCKTRPVCGTPPFIPHSKHSDLVGTEFELNKTVTYECFNGYEPNGSTEAVCVHRNDTVFWSIDLICVRKNCGDPGNIENGYRKISGYVFTSSVNYFCNDGYILAGRALRYCQSDGHWGGELPVCKPVKCSQPKDPQNGRAFYDNYTYGSIVKYQCKSNFKLHGPQNRTCQSNREWSGDEPDCKIIDCGQPDPFPNGYIEIQSTTIGSTIYFYCFDGMIFDGQYTNSTCTINGTWNPYPFPKCMAPCSVPQIINGMVENLPPRTKIQHGQPINVTCIPNYDLAYQSNPIVCYNGSWSQSPNCVPARCKKLPLRPNNGFVVAPKTEHGMRALFICNDGYILEGPNITYCHFGVWNITSPTCNPIYCPFPGYIDNGNVMLVGHMGMYDYRPYIKHVTNNRQIIYECDRGYHIVEGPPGATCIDGQWSPSELPRCELYSHPKLLRWNRSVKTLMRYNEESDTNERYEQQEPMTTKSKPSHQRRRKRHQNRPSCTRLPEKKLMKISIVRLGNGNDTYPHGTRIRLACDDGYVTTNPNRTLIKCAKGRWKPELPDCVPAPCITPTVPNARFHLHRRLLQPGELVKHENRIEFICEEGYHEPVPLTNVTLRCSYGSWDSFSSSQICVPKPCRLQRRHLPNGYYLDLTFDTDGTYIEHDSLVSFECLPGFKPNKTGEYRCSFGKIEPESPQCITENSNVIPDQSTTATTPPSQIYNDGSVSSRCRSPEKIENALFYFDQLLSQRLTLIGVAQVDHVMSAYDDFNLTNGRKLDYRFVQQSSLPFEYDHGTEIVFRCVTYASKMTTEQINGENDSMANQTKPTRSTWIIRCENGNWIGRSFECENDFMEMEPEEKDELIIKESNDLNLFHSISGNGSCMAYTNDSNIRMYNGEQIISNGTFFAHGTIIKISCSDIGRYQLIGPKERFCHNGIWSRSDPYCAGLSQEYDYSLDKPPTILFRNQLGPIAQSFQGKLIVYPGTILHLDCLWKRKYGTPQWSWKLAQRQYLQYWTTDSSLEYRLTIFHAQESDSGLYTCQTPNLHIHTIEIKVLAIHCPNLNLTSPMVNNADYIDDSIDANSTNSTTIIPTMSTSLLRIAETITNGENNNKMGTMIRFECILGTSLVGLNSIQCLPNGQWSDPIPTCNVTQCYDLSSNLTAIIQQMNQSNNVELQTSQRNLPRIEPAQIVEMNRTIGSKVIFTCPRGYGLQGSNHELECLPSGHWSGSIPYCQEVRCGDPMVPKNGYIEGISMDQQMNVYFAGDIVQYACNDGYMIDGNPISICQENGRWSGPITKCKPSCNYPGLMHGSRLVSEVKFFYEVNETINFECYEGTKLKGNRSIKCISSGRWSGPIPECVPINMILDQNDNNIDIYH
ncbi:sushi, von Willebrand factor type A, EGF and pentraxin domain-containing protein 1-like isoform X1 [Dermatophagoides pteronyssinus]|uniref:sushi, von Willebrand factor type A, EGF and pentraxin domain-containing protein 1-like isoform X1 n=1 Tax=Dermatophagoides pteronyssinus TaxID=6956 RepID=UPI003F678132